MLTKVDLGILPYIQSDDVIYYPNGGTFEGKKEYQINPTPKSWKKNWNGL